jgi:hypothetical protein
LLVGRLAAARGHGHVQKFLVGGGTADTHVLKTDGGYPFDQATWVDWGVPTLQ